MARATRWLNRLSFGGRIPWGVGLLLTLTLVPSLIVAFGGRHGAPLLALAELVPREVWRGQVWRLITWPFIAPSALGLLLTCLTHFWLGRDLASELGSPRFVRVLGGVSLAAAVATCLMGLIDPHIIEQSYIGGWPLTVSMLIAWGLWFPEREIRLFFLLSIRGYWIAWLTVAVTIIYSVYAGWESYFDGLAAEAATLAWIFLPSMLKRARREREAKKRELQRRDEEEKWAVRRREDDEKRALAAAEIRRLDAAQTGVLAGGHSEGHDEDDEPPPLPPELEAKMRQLLTVDKRGRSLIAPNSTDARVRFIHPREA